MGEALAKLAEEDPTFRAHTDQETGQTIIAGMGELHLETVSYTHLDVYKRQEEHCDWKNHPEVHGPTSVEILKKEGVDDKVLHDAICAHLSLIHI